MPDGRQLTIHAEKASRGGKVIRPLFLRSPSAIISAALSAGIKKGMGNLFFCVIRETTKPGQTTLTSMPQGLIYPLNASPQARTAFLDPE